MPEPIEQPLTDPSIELEKLRQVNIEVLAKRARDKARIAELEATSAELQAKVTTAETAAQKALIDVPLQKMAESISIVPSIFLEQFQKSFKVEHVDGKLVPMTIEGKPLIDSKGNNVPFENSALVKYLTETEPKSESAKLYSMICIASRASGAMSVPSQHLKTRSKPSPKIHFGLR